MKGLKNTKEPFPETSSTIIKPFPSGEIRAQLPRDIATIRVIAGAIFTLLLGLKLSATIFLWPVVIVGAAFVGWTIYSNFPKPDPLVEAFYTICGGKKEFEKLPEVKLDMGSEEISSAIEKLVWKDLPGAISRAKTPDGRQIIIVKGEGTTSSLNKKSEYIQVFVERLAPSDYSPKHRDHLGSPPFVASFFHAVFRPHLGNTFGCQIYNP